jgi:GDP-L-fucose synthase
MYTHETIYVAGHRGMVGSAIKRQLHNLGYKKLLLRSSDEFDLRKQDEVNVFFDRNRPHYVFLAAAKVGGILANNTFRADFLYDNLMIQTNLIHAAWKYGVKKLLFLGSSCIYPKAAPQPLKEEYLLGGQLEPTNEPYAIAKIAGVKLCEAYRDQYGADFVSVMPTNLYGIGDHYRSEQSHVLPALIRRFHFGKVNNEEEVVVWGSGTPKREFMYADDLADACLFIMKNYNGRQPINIGTGVDLSIRELAEMIKATVGFKGKISFDPEKPDGTPRKLLDISRLQKLGWQYKTRLENGIELAYQDFLQSALAFA